MAPIGRPLALTLAMTLTGAAIVPRDAGGCTLPTSKAVHRYWGSDAYVRGTPSNTDRCSLSFSGWRCHLSGWLYTPTGTSGSDLPALVFIHGSGGSYAAGESISQNGECEMINYFVSRGYVVWAPLMRGVADSTGGATPATGNSTSAGFVNTGVQVSDWSEAESTPGSANYGWYTASLAAWGISSPTADDYTALTTLEYMDEEVDDIQLALTYLVSLPALVGRGPLVDSDKIAMSGHSYGGATIVLASSHALTPLPKATVNMSGGVMSWTSSDIWKKVLKYYAAQHKQALMSRLNDDESSTQDFTPGEAIYNAANGSGTGSAKLKKYSSDTDLDNACPPSSYTTFAEMIQCYHTHFQIDANQVLRWAPDVETFLVNHGVQ
jgi:pimeloyl-ACP methyl ester carboxylesterase